MHNIRIRCYKKQYAKENILENQKYLLNTLEKREKIKRKLRDTEDHMQGVEYLSNQSSRKIEQENAGKEITKEIIEENFPEFNKIICSTLKLNKCLTE